VGVGFHKLEARIFSTRLSHKRRRDIHAYAVRRLERRQKIAAAATQFENAGACGDQETVDSRQTTPVIMAYFLPPRRAGCIGISILRSLFGMYLLTGIDKLLSYQQHRTGSYYTV
jgi:hypothetical protein